MDPIFHMNQLWMADQLAKRGLAHPETCTFCDQDEETIHHLLVGCVFFLTPGVGTDLPAVRPAAVDARTFCDSFPRLVEEVDCCCPKGCA